MNKRIFVALMAASLCGSSFLEITAKPSLKQRMQRVAEGLEGKVLDALDAVEDGVQRCDEGIEGGLKKAKGPYDRWKARKTAAAELKLQEEKKQRENEQRKATFQVLAVTGLAVVTTACVLYTGYRLVKSAFGTGKAK